MSNVRKSIEKIKNKTESRADCTMENYYGNALWKIAKKSYYDPQIKSIYKCFFLTYCLLLKAKWVCSLDQTDDEQRAPQDHMCVVNSYRFVKAHICCSFRKCQRSLILFGFVVVSPWFNKRHPNERWVLRRRKVHFNKFVFGILSGSKDYLYESGGWFIKHTIREPEYI